jgi:hypothetical protein
MRQSLRRILTLAYLLCIYATLAVVRPLAEQLRSAGMLRWSVLLLFAGCIVAAAAWRYKESDRKRITIRTLLLILLALIALFLPGLPEERIHFLTYGLLGWMICWSMEPCRPISVRFWLTALLFVWLAGGIDELIQWQLPSRVFDLRDIVFNGTAGMLGIALFATGTSGKTTAG